MIGIKWTRGLWPRGKWNGERVVGVRLSAKLDVSGWTGPWWRPRCDTTWGDLKLSWLRVFVSIGWEYAAEARKGNQ